MRYPLKSFPFLRALEPASLRAKEKAGAWEGEEALVGESSQKQQGGKPRLLRSS